MQTTFCRQLLLENVGNHLCEVVNENIFYDLSPHSVLPTQILHLLKHPVTTLKKQLIIPFLNDFLSGSPSVVIDGRYSFVLCFLTRQVKVFRRVLTSPLTRPQLSPGKGVRARALLSHPSLMAPYPVPNLLPRQAA